MDSPTNQDIIMGQAKHRKTEITALKFNSGPGLSHLLLQSGSTSPAPPSGKNLYQISVDMTPALLKTWLLKNGCPTAAGTVAPGDGYQSEFYLAGNVSALSTLGVLGGLNFRFTWTAVGGSIPLHVVDGDTGVKRTA